MDEFFGKHKNSMSVQVASAKGGYGGPITGNCRAQYDMQKFKLATVVVQEDAYHEAQYCDDNTWRSVIADFLKNAGANADTWESLKACSIADGVYTCPRDGPTTCTTIDGKYQVNPSSSFRATT